MIRQSPTNIINVWLYRSKPSSLENIKRKKVIDGGKLHGPHETHPAAV